jgi:hypothetical protein
MVETIKGWMKAKDFEALYQILHDSDALTKNDKEELLPHVLEIATETVHEHIINREKVNFEEKSEHFMLRFLYENAMNHYETGELHEAKEAFCLLASISNSKHFEKSLKRHILALLEEVDFDVFVTKWVEPRDLKHFYISSFSKVVEKRFKVLSDRIDDVMHHYKKLFK